MDDQEPPDQPPPSTLEPEALCGFRGPEACALAGITYRQLDYWCRTRLVEPTVREAVGSGSQRLYSRTDVVRLRLVHELLQAGIALPVIRSTLLSALLASPDDPRTVLATPHVTVLVDVEAIAAAIPEPPAVPDAATPPALALVR